MKEKTAIKIIIGSIIAGACVWLLMGFFMFANFSTEEPEQYETVAAE